jgi:hypothetical protein
MSGDCINWTTHNNFFFSRTHFPHGTQAIDNENTIIKTSRLVFSKSKDHVFFSFPRLNGLLKWFFFFWLVKCDIKGR